MPVRDLPDSLGQRVDHRRGSAVAKAFDGMIVGAVGVFGGIPKADDDAVQRKVRTNTLTDGTRLGEGERRQGGNEDDLLGSFASQPRIWSETAAGR